VTTRVLLQLLAGAALLLVLGAAPAGADPAGPSDYRSRVTQIEPRVEGVTARIKGGDTYLQITVAKGHEVVVDGYDEEPYVRFLKDGTVERNLHSEATYINHNRKGTGTIPPEAKRRPDGRQPEPLWEKVASNGSYAWHDHRVHWMGDASPEVPRGHYVGGRYAPWQVPITVDGTRADVEGTLLYEHSMSPVPWIAIGVLAAVVLAIVGRRQVVAIPAAALLVVSAAAVVVGRSDFNANPGGGNPLLWALPLVAALAALYALARHAAGSAVVGLLASVATLSSWALLRYKVLLKPVIPTTTLPGLDRSTVAVALGVAVAAAYLAITGGGLRLPELDDD
jgi:hypothetical protein